MIGSRLFACLNRGCNRGLGFPYENVNDAMGVIMRIDVQAMIIDEML